MILLASSRRSLENPAIDLQDPEAWNDIFGVGATSESGIVISREAALGYAAFWRGVNLMSTYLGKLPLVTYKRVEAGGKEKDRQHAAFQLLRYKPSEFYTAFVFKQTLQHHAMMEGNGYAYIMRRGDGTPLELLILSPSVTHPVREDGKLWYVTTVDTEQRKLAPENVLHIRGLGFDGLAGYSVRSIARDSLGLGISARKNTSLFMKNASRPSVVLEHPSKLSPEAQTNLKRHWESMSSGLENAHRTAILEEGMTAHVLSTTAKDAQMMELRQHELREVANWVGVPAHKLGDPTRTSYKSLEQENQAFLDDGLDGWLVNWEEECRDKLLSEEQKLQDTHLIEFTRQALVRADLVARGQFYSASVGGPWMTPDEARTRENMAALPDGAGAKLAPPPNQSVPADGDEPDGGDGDDVDVDDDAEDERSTAIRAANDELLRDRIAFVLRRIGRDAIREANGVETFCDWLDGGLAERHLSVVVDAMVPVTAVLRASGQVDAVADMYAEAVVDAARGRLNSVAEACTEATLADGVQSEVDSWPDGLEVQCGT